MDLLAVIRRIDTKGDACIDLNEWVEFLRVMNKPAVHHAPAQLSTRLAPGTIHPGSIARVN